MESAKMYKIQSHLRRVTEYLSPLLSIANCHMVEFFTESHWEQLVPAPLRCQLDRLDINEGLEKFWKYGAGNYNHQCELSTFIQTARSHCIQIDGELCLSVDHLKQKILNLGGEMQPQIQVKEFMTSKKSYEVSVMSQLLSSLHTCVPTDVCVDVGGGRGSLPGVVARGYCIPALTVDQDTLAINGGIRRDGIIHKQWKAISKITPNNNNQTSKETQHTKVNQIVKENLNRFVNAYVTENTDLVALIKKCYPEFEGRDDVKLLMTGLHTCGDLGPTSLRIFSSTPSVTAVLNVPCCYHLLTERIQGESLTYTPEIQRDVDKGGFPMSLFMKDYQLGRNARMLAAQSIDRVVDKQEIPATSLYYRALLQVIIKTYFQNTTIAEGKLKRVPKNCKDFNEYLKHADAILKTNMAATADSYLTAIKSDTDLQWKRLVMFYLIRLCLAQVVESVILWDRLLYLVECGYDDVCLVKLFDPVLSPRCHAIMALR